mgnify:CR=1 FL=1
MELVHVNTNHTGTNNMTTSDKLMSEQNMGKTVRLSDAETEAIRQKAIEINKLLIKQGQQPLRDSELVHKILEKSVPYVQLNTKGEVVIETE